MIDKMEEPNMISQVLSQLEEISDESTSTPYGRCKDLLTTAKSYWGHAHATYHQDLAFSNGDQWSAGVKATRDAMQRVTTTYNLVPAIIRQITGVVRQAPPGIKIQPLTGGANRDNAMMLQGVIRAIETNSNASNTYTSALENACEASLGAWRIVVEPCKRKQSKIINVPNIMVNEYGEEVIMGYRQEKQTEIVDKLEAKIKYIQDPTKLYWDPMSEIADFSDANYVIFERALSEKDYKSNYPEGKGRANGMDESITIYELWEINESGLVDFTVFDDNDILSTESTELIHLPFVMMTGKQYMDNGKRIYQSIVHDIKPICQELNYVKSEQMSLVSSAPKHLVTAKADTLISPEDWANSAVAPKSVLYWDGDIPPVFNQGPPPPQGYMEVTNQSMELIRQVTGIYQDPAQQANLANASGKAIKYQQANSSVQTYHMIQNLQLAVKRTGTILLDVMGTYYNDDDIRMSIGIDDRVSPVSIGPTQVEGVHNIDMSVGEYAVTISSGVSYASNKEAMMDNILELARNNPQMFPIIADWYVQQLDMPGSEEVSDRLRATLPPNILAMIDAKGDNSNPSDIIRTQAQKLSQAMQQTQMMSQHLEMLASENEKMKSEQEIKIAELMQKKQINDDNNNVKMSMQEADHNQQDQIAKLNATMELILAKLSGDNKAEIENLKSLNKVSEIIESKFEKD